jgi:hypothetical protein
MCYHEGHTRDGGGLDKMGWVILIIICLLGLVTGGFILANLLVVIVGFAIWLVLKIVKKFANPNSQCRYYSYSPFNPCQFAIKFIKSLEHTDKIMNIWRRVRECDIPNIREKVNNDIKKCSCGSDYTNTPKTDKNGDRKATTFVIISVPHAPKSIIGEDEGSTKTEPNL